MVVESDYLTHPKSLKADYARRVRRALLNRGHVQRLTIFLKKIRSEHPDWQVPDFDPLDGGIGTRALLVLEAPGPRAIESGFVSRDNPNETAKNMFDLLREARIQRSGTILWNIVPYYIGDEGKIRAAKADDIRTGLEHLNRLILQLQDLRAVVLMGRKAQRVKHRRSCEERFKSSRRIIQALNSSTEGRATGPCFWTNSDESPNT